MPLFPAAPYWPDGPPPNTNTSEGETVTFNCQTNGKPTPVVTFYKNGVGMALLFMATVWYIENYFCRGEKCEGLVLVCETVLHVICS